MMHLSYVVLLFSLFVCFYGADSQDAKWGEFGEWSLCKFSAQDKAKVERRIQLCQLNGETVTPDKCSGPPMGETRACMEPTQAAVVFGTKAGDYPSQAFIELDNGDNQCGGSLISGRWVLTAAHCFDNNQKPTRISLGSENKYAKDGQNFTAETTCCHKDYNSANLEHDICLVKLNFRPFPSPAIDTISMTTDTSYPDDGTPCRVVGWGYDEFRRLPDELLEANVSVVNKETCDASYKSIGNPLPKTTICAGHLEGGADTCGGDSGGPIFCKHNDAWTLSGVTSQGHYECGIKNFPGVYTKVADYVPWIEETMKNSCKTAGYHWGEWIKACSVTCGEGIEAKFRPCLDEKNMPAADENCDGESNVVGKCNPGSCEGEGYHWGEWIKACSVTCGEGIEAMFRPCLDAKNMPANDENCDGESKSTGKCNPGSCQVYHWSEWSKMCSVTCGEGEEKMLRICLDDEDNTVDATNCEGESFSVGKCSLAACEIFHWGPWKRVCSVTCGEGTSDMARVCLDSKDREVNTGKCDGDATAQEKCSLPACEVEQKVDATFCFLHEATFDSLDQFQDSFNSLKTELQNNLKLLKEYRSSDIASEYRSASGKIEGVAIISVNVELDSEEENTRVKRLVDVYILALSRGSGFESPTTECGVDPCLSEPCQNDGVCGAIPGSSTLHQCQCRQGYTGQNCETEVVIDPCSQEPCQNDGVCVKMTSSRYRCRCKRGFTGRNCERERVNPCSSDPCENGGSCIRLSATRYRCRCQQGYSGNNCETATVVDPCLSRPCQNGGICTRSSVTSYQCQCMQGFSGNNCQTEITTVVEDFCFQVISRNGLSSQFFSSVFNSFRDDLSKTLRSMSGFRGISFEGSSSRSSSGQDKLEVTIRIQATTGKEKTKQMVEDVLSRHIETSSLKVGLGGKPVTCGSETKTEGEKYCAKISTADVAGSDIKLINIRTDLQSSLKTFPGFQKVDFDTTFESGYMDMTVTVSTSNTAGNSNWGQYLLYLVQRSAQTNGITDNPTLCTESKPLPKNPCSPNPCQNEGACIPQGTVDYYCQCQPQYSGRRCETVRVVTQTQNFCIEVKSVTPNARNLFSAFGRQLQSQLGTVSGYRGVELGAQSRGFSGGEEITITARIQAVPSTGETSADLSTRLLQLVETSARNIGIYGSVTSCN